MRAGYPVDARHNAGSRRPTRRLVILERALFNPKGDHECGIQQLPAMAAETIDFNALLSEGDSMFDRSFRIVAVRHPDEAPFTVANPPTRFRAQLSAGWISGAGVNRIFGGYIMALSVKVLQALSGR